MVALVQDIAVTTPGLLQVLVPRHGSCFLALMHIYAPLAGKTGYSRQSFLPAVLWAEEFHICKKTEEPAYRLRLVFSKVREPLEADIGVLVCYSDKRFSYLHVGLKY
jgi:hypothetical protein